jgi:ectoine hydroxylase-related dioxygenase (phytanoyl-CoA dioxygenase family)
MQSTLTQPGGSLTQEQKKFYEREGYLVLEHFLSDEELAPAREAMNDKVLGNRRGAARRWADK